MSGYQWDILLVASLTAAACASVGVFLVLRRMSMIGDAISHAVLPGIVIAVLITGKLNSPWVVIGAGTLGLVTAGLIEALYRTRRVAEDASIGVVFPALFALGVFLVSRYAGGAHIDTECVLYGEIAFVWMDRVGPAGIELPRSAWIMGAVLAINAGFIALCWKELKIGTFDAQLAAAAGLSPILVQYLLLGAVSATVTAAFESVGAILVVAMLVVPAATAYLLTDRLERLVLLAVGLAVVSAWAGYGLAYLTGCSIAGAMAVAAGALFVPVLLLAPQYGLLARRFSRRRLGRRYAAELVLARLRRTGGPMTVEEIASRLRWSVDEVRRAVDELTERRPATIGPDGRVDVVLPFDSAPTAPLNRTEAAGVGVAHPRGVDEKGSR